MKKKLDNKCKWVGKKMFIKYINDLKKQGYRGFDELLVTNDTFHKKN